jgi:hypothetical protein
LPVPSSDGEGFGVWRVVFNHEVSQRYTKVFGFMAKMKWKGNRIVDCESKNHTSCKGELWECERCHKKVCWEEGSVDLIDLCDNCWHDVRILGKEINVEVCP